MHITENTKFEITLLARISGNVNILFSRLKNWSYNGVVFKEKFGTNKLL